MVCVEVFQDGILKSQFKGQAAFVMMETMTEKRVDCNTGIIGEADINVFIRSMATAVAESVIKLTDSALETYILSHVFLDAFADKITESSREEKEDMEDGSTKN